MYNKLRAADNNNIKLPDRILKDIIPLLLLIKHQKKETFPVLEDQERIKKCFVIILNISRNKFSHLTEYKVDLIRKYFYMTFECPSITEINDLLSKIYTKLLPGEFYGNLSKLIKKYPFSSLKANIAQNVLKSSLEYLCLTKTFHEFIKTIFTVPFILINLYSYFYVRNDQFVVPIEIISDLSTYYINFPIDFTENK